MKERFDAVFGTAEGLELLKRIAVNIANENPNAVIESLVKIHNEIGVFITEMIAAAAPELPELPGPEGEPDLDESDPEML